MVVAVDECVPYYDLVDEVPPDQVRETLAGFFNLCFARSILEERLDRRLRTTADITLAQHEVLYRLSLAPGGRLRMADLAAVLQASKSGASRLVDRMACAGLVERQACPTDRRLVFAVLTPDGRATFVRSAPVFKAEVVAVFGDVLDDDEHRELRRILKKLLAAHDAWDTGRCEPPVMPSPPTTNRGAN
jgi:DNA-binding MarR family transcriptional regulator